MLLIATITELYEQMVLVVCLLIFSRHQELGGSLVSVPQGVMDLFMLRILSIIELCVGLGLVFLMALVGL
ncbi:MAG: hypothetical protein C5S38_06775 [Candidatus Methanophagaceae archaeon]|nr:MAG: hypothetical protein C5S38_06775 [Methanophagales archaeon]